jgi:O-antigen ligase
MFVLAGTAGVISFRNQIEWTGLTFTAALVVFIPMAQYAGGLLVFSGHAWVTSAYLLGFLLALLLGSNWEKNQAGQAINSLFIAIGLACLVSVGMQLHQWMALDGFDLWIVSMAGNRPFANLAQPNQLATFLFWGLISIGWFAHHKKIGPFSAVFLAMFFLLGIALTQSRTAMVAIALSLVAGWHWRNLWYTKSRLWIAVGLALFFALCVLGIGLISDAMLLTQRFDAIDRITSGGIRFNAYKLFVDAVLQRPFWGYGWANLGPAQMLVAENHVELGGVFQHAHNLFLDLMLWTGIPVGLLLGGVLLCWFYFQIKKVARVDEALLVLFVGAFWWHAMLELPHQYAYMLLPVGLVMGVLSVRSGTPILFRTHHLFFAALWLSATCLLAVITRDYFRMEADFQALRFERSYGKPAPVNAPETLVLSQLEAFIKMGRMLARPGMDSRQLDWMRDTADSFPSPANQFLYTSALALNGYSDQAQKRMKILQKVMTSNDYEELGRIWMAQSKVNLLLGKTQWILRN